MSENNKWKQQGAKQLPIVKNEDVEFAVEVADTDDFEAAERAQSAEYRQEDQ